MDLFTWAILLLLAGMILVVVEFFIPSSGVLGVSALICLVTATVFAFQYSGALGLTFMACIVLGVPLLLAMGANLWPHTPIGRRVLLHVPRAADVLPDSSHRRKLKKLLGQSGQAKSLMMPSGAIEIAGETIDALSEGPSIEPGTMVKVIEVRGTQVVVRPSVDQASSPTIEPPTGLLQQSVDALGLKELNEPLN